MHNSTETQRCLNLLTGYVRSQIGHAPHSGWKDPRGSRSGHQTFVPGGYSGTTTALKRSPSGVSRGALWGRLIQDMNFGRQCAESGGGASTSTTALTTNRATKFLVPVNKAQWRKASSRTCELRAVVPFGGARRLHFFAISACPSLSLVSAVFQSASSHMVERFFASR
jgi:hypothetical protein